MLPAGKKVPDAMLLPQEWDCSAHMHCLEAREGEELLSKGTENNCRLYCVWDIGDVKYWESTESGQHFLAMVTRKSGFR
jgi:hypothetical protein